MFWTHNCIINKGGVNLRLLRSLKVSRVFGISASTARTIAVAPKGAVWSGSVPFAMPAGCFGHIIA